MSGADSRELFRLYGRTRTRGKVHDAVGRGWPEPMQRKTDCGSGVIELVLFELPDLSPGIGRDDVFFLLAEHGVAPRQLCAACYPIRFRTQYAGWIRRARAGEVNLAELAAKHGRPTG